MEIIINNEGTVHQQIIIKDIEGDMGEDSRLQLLQQSDGDVVLTLYNIREGCMDSIEFCSRSGGSRYPWVASRLREIISIFLKGKPK